MTNTALSAVAAEIDALGLSLATEKTEAVMFRRKYTDTVPKLFPNDTQIAMKRCIKYLGIQVNDNLYFNEYAKSTADKVQNTLQVLSRLMPNIGGPKEPRRKLLVSVVQSVILYGAPVWGPSLEYSKKLSDQLLRVQCRVALRCICAYRTTS